MEQEKFTLFWNGPFSQWHYSEFKDEKRTYNCTEQFMMYWKAIMMSDREIAEKIMSIPYNPREYKALGRQVKNFNAELWNDRARAIVKKGNMLKFSQNPKLLKELKDTVGTTLVEASPYDKIWGIGLPESDPRCLDRSQWRGTNWLGEVLTDVRKELIGE